jgi:hypothetical protein
VTLTDDTLVGVLDVFTTYTYTARSFDQAGNPSDLSSSLVIYRDTTAPVKPIGPGTSSSPELLPEDDTGVSGDRITNKTQPRIRGVVETNVNPPSTVLNQANAGTIVRLYEVIGTTRIFLGSAVADAVTGAFVVQPGLQVVFTGTDTAASFTTIPFSAALTNGPHTLVVTAEDLAGNVSVDSDPLAITVITTLPKMPNLELVGIPPVAPDSYVTNNTRPPFAGSNADNGNFVDLVVIEAPAGFNQVLPYVLATTTARADGRFSFMQTLALQPDEIYKIQAISRDVADNRTASNLVMVTIDTMAPTGQPTLLLQPSDDTGLPGDNVTHLRRPFFINNPAIQVEPGLFVDILEPQSIPGNPANLVVRGTGVVDANGNFRIQLPSDLVNGPVTLISRYRDQAGNTGTTLSTPLDVRIITVRGDYDLDGKADLAIYRPGNSLWAISPSSGDPTSIPNNNSLFGQTGDVPLQGDYDGDGKTDLALYRPSTSEWFLLRSQMGSFATSLGTPGDLAVPADYDGDGVTDLAVFRPTTGEWFYNGSMGGPLVRRTLGQAGDLPVPADFSGDYRADPAVFRPTTGDWFYIDSTSATIVRKQLGQQNDVPVPEDYTGAGKATPAVFRPTTGEWFHLDPNSDAIMNQTYGQPADVPVPQDYTGDGIADLATYRYLATLNAPALWNIRFSGSGQGIQTPFGNSTTDVPIPAPYHLRLPSLVTGEGYRPYGDLFNPPNGGGDNGGSGDNGGGGDNGSGGDNGGDGGGIMPSPDTTPPQVVGLTVNKRTNGNVANIVVQFNESIDTASAVDRNNYILSSILGAGARIPIRKAIYDSANRSVTLRPRGPLRLVPAKRLTIQNLFDSAGNLLDGDRNGTPGGAYTAVLRNRRIIEFATTTVVPRQLLVTQAVPAGALARLLGKRRTSKK